MMRSRVNSLIGAALLATLLSSCGVRKALHHMPGMSVEEAAHVIERAIVERPDDISPPWLWGMQVASVTLSKPVRLLMQKTYRPAFTKR